MRFVRLGLGFLWLVSVCSVASAEIFDVAASSFQFTPSQLTIQVGDTVRWTNQGGVHNVTADDDSFRCSNGCDGEGGNGAASGAAWVTSVTFTAAGTVGYHCQPHQAIGMVGTIVVEGAASEPEPGEILIAQSPVPVDEDAGQALVTMRRQNGSDGAVAIDFSTDDNTATAGQDYEASQGTVVWSDGDSADKQVAITILDDQVTENNETFDVDLSNPTGGATLGAQSSALVRIFDDDIQPTVCVSGDTTLCLYENDRFKVEVVFDDGQGLGPRAGQVIDFGERDSGLFYFFARSNAEILIKVLNACVPVLGNKYWVFYAATTDVKFDITVTDTEAGVSKTYSNPLGMKAESVTDITAFDTCP